MNLIFVNPKNEVIAGQWFRDRTKMKNTHILYGSGSIELKDEGGEKIHTVAVCRDSIGHRL